MTGISLVTFNDATQMENINYVSENCLNCLKIKEGRKKGRKKEGSRFEEEKKKEP